MPEIEVVGSKALLDKALKDVPASLLPHGITGGETKILWSRNNPDEVENARRTFNDLKKKGFAAFSVKKDGSGEKGAQIFEFNESDEGIIMVHQMRGGL